MISNKLKNIAIQLSNSPEVFYGLFGDNVTVERFNSMPNLVWINPLKVSEEDGMTPFDVTVDVELFFYGKSSIDCPEDLRASVVDAQRLIAYEYVTRLQNDSSLPRFRVGSFSIDDHFISISNLHLSGVSLKLTGKYKPEINYCYGSN